MIRFACGSCGKKFGVKDEYAGRRSKCPACGTSIEVPLRDAWEEAEEEAEAAEPTPIPWRPTPPPVVPKPQPIPDDEPESYRSPAKSDSEKKRPAWKDPVVIIGAAAPTLILALLSCYLYVERTESEFARRVDAMRVEALELERANQRQVAIEKYGSIVAMVHEKSLRADRYRQAATDAERAIERIRADLKAEAEREEERRRARAEELAAEEQARKKPKPKIHLNDEEVKRAAELFIRAQILAACRSVKDTEEVTIQKLDLQVAPVDKRRLPWLWLATVNVAVTEKPQRLGSVGHHLGMVWKELFQYTPNAKGGECWREITMVRDGTRTRKHLDLSEWNPIFRSQVFEDWLEKFQEYSRNFAADDSLTRTDKLEALQEAKRDLARGFGITVEELDEILASTDELPQTGRTKRSPDPVTTRGHEVHSSNPPSDQEIAKQIQSQGKAGTIAMETSWSDHFVAAGDAPKDYRQTSLDTCESFAVYFVAYFGKRGFSVTLPKRRMALVALRDAASFKAYTGKDGRDGSIGFYDFDSNRVVTFDQRGPQWKNGDQGMEVNRFAVAHDATLLLCYNTGLLSRYTDVPGAITFGLATHGELWGIQPNVNVFDSTNSIRLDAWKAPGQKKAQWFPISKLLTEESLFERQETVQAALGESWVLVHYLLQPKRIRLFRNYLKGMPGRWAGLEARLKHAEACFGSLQDLDRTILNYGRDKGVRL